MTNEKQPQHPDEPAYSERELAMANDPEQDGEQTSDTGSERAVVRRDLHTERDGE